MWEDSIYGSDMSSDSVGYQNDGTYNTPSAGTTPQPYDTGGGAPQSYSKDIVDMFKFGVGTYAANKNVQANLDYKRFEATGGGLYRQGLPNLFNTGAQGQSSGLMIMAAVLILAVVLINHNNG